MSRPKQQMIHLFPEFSEMAEDLSCEEFRELFFAVSDYQLHGKAYNGNNRIISVLFKSAKLQFDRYSEICSKNRANRTKGDTESHETPPNDTDETQGLETPQNTPPIPIPYPNPVPSNPIQSNPVQESERAAARHAHAQTKTKNFIKPTVQELLAFCKEQKLGIDAQRFYDYYEAIGWQIGRSPMRDWKAAARSWARLESEKPEAKRSFYAPRAGVPMGCGELGEEEREAIRAVVAGINTA